MADWEQLIEIAPVIAAAMKRGPGQAAFLQGYLNSKRDIDNRRRLDQQQQRQDYMAQAEVQNRIADNQRADTQLALQRLQAARGEQNHLQGNLQAHPETELPAGTDLLQAQNALVLQQLASQQAYGIQGPQAPLPNMTQLVSEGKKRRAQQLMDRFDKEWKDRDPAAQDSLSPQSGEFAGMTFGQIRKLTQSDVPPAPPIAKTRVPAMPGSMEEFSDPNTTPERRAQILADRKAYSAADNTPKAGDEPISPDDVQGAAQAILSGRMAPSQLSLVGGMGNRGVKFKQAVVAEINKRNPSFNWQESEAGYQFGKSTGTQNTVRYLQSVQESMPRVLLAAQKLGNGNIRSINALINAGKNQVNDVDLKTFQTDVLLVADEVAKILQGGGTGSGTSDAKLRQAGQILSTSDSPQAIIATLNEVNTLLGFREKSLTQGTFLQKPSANELPAGVTVKRIQ